MQDLSGEAVTRSRIPMMRHCPQSLRSSMKLRMPTVAETFQLPTAQVVPMARTTIVQLTDDIDGSEADHTVEFSYKGKSYYLDLKRQQRL
jgi:hypothetical protein